MNDSKFVGNVRIEGWRRLIDMGVFDGDLPQRVNACFQYLVGPDSQFFTLRDFTEKGKFVMTNLSINNSQAESGFAVMDVFRRFDRDACGEIFLDDFVLGIIDRLNRYLTDDRIIETVVLDKIPHGSVSATTLRESLQERRNNDPFTLYFNSISYITLKLFDHLKSQKSGDEAVSLMVDSETFSRILRETVRVAVYELQQEFHLLPERVKAIVTDHASSSHNIKDTILEVPVG